MATNVTKERFGLRAWASLAQCVCRCDTVQLLHCSYRSLQFLEAHSTSGQKYEVSDLSSIIQFMCLARRQP